MLSPHFVLAFEHQALRGSNDAIRLDASEPFETIVATTCGSVYEIIVLDRDVGDVLVRGGAKFPEFRRVRFVGSTPGGSALKPGIMDIGLRMEFHLGRRVVVTSRVRKLSRRPAACDAANPPLHPPSFAESGVI